MEKTGEKYMLKVIAKFESVVENRVGHFLLDHDTPITVAKEMCFNFLKYIGQMEDQAKAAAQQAETHAPTSEAQIDESGMPPEQPKSE